MGKAAVLGSLLMLGVGFMASADESKTKAVDSSNWHTDWDEARTIARQKGKPIFLVFR